VGLFGVGFGVGFVLFCENWLKNGLLGFYEKLGW